MKLLHGWPISIISLRCVVWSLGHQMDSFEHPSIQPTDQGDKKDVHLSKLKCLQKKNPSACSSA